MITAALPTYKNKEIIFVQLESLCNQVNAPEWELIVCEEAGADAFGAEGLQKYVDRLTKANCKRIVYLSLNKWCALGEKWLIIRDNMHPKSIGFMLCASDNYSPSDRIENSYLAMKGGFEWYQCQTGNFYNIKSDKAGLFKAWEGIPALFMCISRKGIEKVNGFKFPKKGVDTWLFKSVNPKKVKYDPTTDGVHTDGFNTISHYRRNLYSGKTASGMFEKADEKEVFNRFPENVKRQIKALK